MAENPQNKLRRVCLPRVQISYNVHTGGAMEKVDLPFVVGVMGDMSGDPLEKLPEMKDPTRKFVNLDPDNFNDVLRQMAPRVAMSVPNRLTDEDNKLGVELNFKQLSDFSPDKVAEQVPALKELLEMRKKLVEVMAKATSNDKFEKLLGEVIANTEKAAALAKEFGITADATTPKPEGKS